MLFRSREMDVLSFFGYGVLLAVYNSDGVSVAYGKRCGRVQGGNGAGYSVNKRYTLSYGRIQSVLCAFPYVQYTCGSIPVPGGILYPGRVPRVRGQAALDRACRSRREHSKLHPLGQVPQVFALPKDNEGNRRQRGFRYEGG